MDTSRLVVGQDVFTYDGFYGGWAKVIEVTPTGVIVELDSPASGLVRFDKNGTACEIRDVNEYPGPFWGDTKISGSEHGPNKLYRDPVDAGFLRHGPPSDSELAADPVLAKLMAAMNMTKSR